MTALRPRALLAMADKDQAERIAARLVSFDWEIVATSGTADRLRGAGLPVRDAQDVTGVPVLLGGRAKTLTLELLGGLLWRHGHPQDERDARTWRLLRWDLVAVDIKPTPDVSKQDPLDVEWIDFGGPAAARAAAKNHQHIAVLMGSHIDRLYLERLEAVGGNPKRVDSDIRRQLAIVAFEMLGEYDLTIAERLRAAAPPQPNPRS